MCRPTCADPFIFLTSVNTWTWAENWLYNGARNMIIIQTDFGLYCGLRRVHRRIYYFNIYFGLLKLTEWHQHVGTRYNGNWNLNHSCARTHIYRHHEIKLNRTQNRATTLKSVQFCSTRNQISANNTQQRADIPGLHCLVFNSKIITASHRSNQIV